MDKNAIVVTALNPLIGYAAGAALVKQALTKNVSIRELALEQAEAGILNHIAEDRPVKQEEIEAALRSPQLSLFLFQFADYADTGQVPRQKEQVV